MTTPAPDSPTRARVFVNGEDGYACYRIPGIVALPNGDLLAVAEGRRDNCGDHGGVIRIVARRSADGGRSWGPLIEVARNVLPDGSEHVAQNPSPVVDRMDPAHPEGKVILLFNKAEHGERVTAAGGAVRRVFAIESSDGGRTWTNERDITADVHRPHNPGYTAVHADAASRYAHPDDWRCQFPPVGHAIQLRGGVADRPETRGRLFFAAYTTVGDRDVFHGQNYAIWSDDHGATWRHSDPSPVIGPNEAMAVELEDGSVLVNFRNYATPDATIAPHRGQMIHTFDERGEIQVATAHTEPPELPQNRTGLQGGIHRHGWSDGPGGVSRILFSTADHPDGRLNMTVWLSEDEGRTWPVKRLVDPGPSAYSDLAVLPDGRIVLLYELGGDNGVDCVSFELDWLTRKEPAQGWPARRFGGILLSGTTPARTPHPHRERLPDMTIDAPALHGIIPPIATPLTPERAFDEASFRRAIDQQLAAGIHGLFVLGSTSEAPLLTADMQDAVIATAVDQVAGRVPVLAGCIEFSTERVIARGTRARELGADGIVACPPFYVTPSRQEIVRHFELVHDTVGLPILAYDIPSATHVKLERPVLRALAEAGTIVALKDSSGQDANFRGVVLDNRDLPGFRIFTGSELTADSAIYVGAHGLVPGLGNVDAAGYVRLYDACVAGDWATAKAEQERLFRLFGIIDVPSRAEYGNSSAAHGAFKVAMWLQGLIDHPTTAHPHTPLTREHCREIAAILRSCDLPVVQET